MLQVLPDTGPGDAAIGSLTYRDNLVYHRTMVIEETGLGLQNPSVFSLLSLRPGSASKTESRPAPMRRVPSAGAVNGRYNPRARASTRAGIVTPTLLTYHKSARV